MGGSESRMVHVKRLAALWRWLILMYGGRDTRNQASSDDLLTDAELERACRALRGDTRRGSGS